MQPPATPRDDFRPDINGLRALSVLLVLLYHFRVPGFGGGYIGVDVFFVISGYLMTRIVVSQQLQGRFGYWRFLQARANRIFPALAVMLLALLLVGVVALPPIDLLAFAEQSVTAALFYANEWFRLRQGYFAAGKDEQWLLHTWSLGVEWQFYLLHPLLLMAGWRLARGAVARSTVTARRAGGIALATAFALSLLTCLLATPQFAFFSLAARAWELLAGGLVFCAEGALLRLGDGTRLALGRLGLLVLLAANVVAAQDGVESQWPGAYALLPITGAVLVIGAATNRHRLLGNPIAQHVGRWSYSIYLWHWPLVVAAGVLGASSRYPVPTMLLGVGASIALGALSYALVETRRLPALLRAPLIGRPVVVSMASVALASWLVVAGDGLMFRSGAAASLQRELLDASRRMSTPDSCIPPNEWAESRRACDLAGHGGDKRVLVIGDSHAEHLYAWFQRHAQGPTRFMVAFGCPIVPGLDRPSRAALHCADHSAQAFAEAGSGHYDTVVISANWASLVTSGERVDLCRVVAGGGCQALRPTEDAELPLVLLQRAVRELSAAGVDVVLVGSTPFSARRVPQQLAREQYWSGTPKLALDLASSRRQVAPIEAVLRELAASTPHVHRADLRPAFCDGERCPMFDRTQGVPVFKDRDHFNPPWIAARDATLLPLVGRLPALAQVAR
jgi:peptidoglycan/LPS O-acetylase OafA/YrhL